MKKITILAITTLISFLGNAQNVGINTSGATPDAGAGLDIDFTNKGLLIPRVNITNLATIAPIVGSSTTSMLVYNTNVTTGPGYYYWNGSQWVRFATNGEAWRTTGNAGTNAAANFLGTTDNVALRIRTNNIERFEFTTDGRLRSLNAGSAGAPTYSWTADSDIGMFRPAVNTLAFSTTGLERMRIDNNGVVGVGTTNPSNSTYGASSVNRLHVVSSTTGSGAAMAEFSNTSGNGVALFSSTMSTTNGFNTIEGVSLSNNLNGFFLHQSTTNTRVGLYGVTNSGNNFWGIYTPDNLGALDFWFVSDKNLKKEINSFSEISESFIDKVLLLNPVQYKYDNDNYPSFGNEERLKYGFLAQELVEIFPNLVAENTVYNPNSLPTKGGEKTDLNPTYSSVNYNGLIPILTRAIQEQQEQIVDLEERIQQLEQIVLQNNGN